MKFKNYIHKKRIFIVVWMLINAFALFVNLTDIRGKLESERGADGVHKTIYVFTSYSSTDGDRENFWPFVSFESDSYYDYYEKSFNGLFYHYDISEFIAYTVILLIILFFGYENSKKKKDSTEEAPQVIEEKNKEVAT